MLVLRLKWPVIIIVIAATAAPIGVHGLDPGAVAASMRLVPVDWPDLLQNIAGYVPVGLVLASHGALRAVTMGALLSLAAESAQFFMLYRSPSIVDVWANIVGTLIGVLVARRIGVPTLLRLDRRAAVAAALAATLLLAWVWAGAGSAPSLRGHGEPGVLEAHWAFDEGDGRSSLDSSGHGLLGNFVQEPRRVAGVSAGAVEFDGSGAIGFGRPAALRLQGSMTLSAWIRPTAFPGDDAAIVSSYDGHGFQLDTTVDTGRRTLGLKLTNECGEPMSRYGKTELVAGSWHHVAGVFDAEAATMDVYIDGMLDNGVLEGPVTHGQKSSREVVQVGRRGSDSLYGFIGTIDEVRIYSQALTAAQIAQDMRAAAPPDWQPSRAIVKPAPAAPRPPVAPVSCALPADRDDARLAGAAALLGILAAIAAVADTQTSRSMTCLLAGCLAGLGLIAITAGTLAVSVRWTLLAIAVAGAASVAIQVRDQHSMQ